jgi:ribonuclease P protein component
LAELSLALIEAMGIPASMRLRRPREFQKVRSMGHRIHCGPFIFQCCVVPGQAPPRLGVIASRRVGNAVKRNYGKRIFRECFRQHAAELPHGSEAVVVLRSGFDRYSFQDLEARFLQACRRICQLNADGDLKSTE